MQHNPQHTSFYYKRNSRNSAHLLMLPDFRIESNTRCTTSPYPILIIPVYSRKIDAAVPFHVTTFFFAAILNSKSHSYLGCSLITGCYRFISSTRSYGNYVHPYLVCCSCIFRNIPRLYLRYISIQIW